MNRSLLFKFLSAVIFSLVIFELITHKIVAGYSLLILGYYLLRRSDKEE
ncbi:hypothetical protein [Carnobacterium mobile]|nr:hypothetical protein [Carnobacterium mobile]